MQEALDLFGEMLEKGRTPDEITYNTLMNGLCKIGSTVSALQLFRHIKKASSRPKPDTITYSILIDGLCKDGLLNEALDLFSEMIDSSISPNVVTYTSLLHGLCNSGWWKEATR
ncbi:hypothetical protein AAC387_Pa02g1778 [Persea americana]